MLNARFSLNKLSLNLHKTSYVTFDTNNLDSTIQIAINCSNIEKGNSTKYLGVHIDHHLNWNTVFISSKLSKSTAVIHRTSHVLYNTLILPYFTYCCITWGFTYQTYINKLSNIQKSNENIYSFPNLLSFITTLQTTPIFKHVSNYQAPSHILHV